jgi:alcohol dehydrogenase class IV
MSYNFPGSINFSWGESEKIVEHVNKIGMKKPLIVTDKGIIRIGLIQGIKKKLNAEKIEFAIYGGINPNPTEADVMGGVDFYQDQGCDSVIAVGGGSPIDGARGILTMVSHPGMLHEYYVGAVNRRIIHEVPPFIAIPTTSGTGSEASTGGIITDSDNRKRAFSSPKLLPKMIILDPSLTTSMPQQLTAYTGLDALSHNLEAFIVDTYAPICDAFAREGMRLVAKSLISAHIDGTNREARMDMMLASTMGSLAFMKGLGVVHSLAHQLSTQCDIPHGAACGIMTPHSIRYNLDEKKTLNKYVEIAGIFGEDNAQKNPEKAAILFEDLLKTLNVEPRLSRWGVTDKDIRVMSKNAMLDHCHPMNPRVCTMESMEALYRAAF